MKPGDLTIFVDESGSPDVINAYGKDLLAAGQTSDYFVLGAVRTADPAALRAQMQSSIDWANAQYGTGVGKAQVTGLHAVSDRGGLRSQVLNGLASLPVKAMAIAMDKRLLDPAKPWRGDRIRFYNEMAALLLGESLHLHATTRIIFSHKNHDSIADLTLMTKEIAKRWGAVLKRTGAPPTTASADHKKPGEDSALYAADYIAWAVFRAFERGDMRHITKLEPILGHVWDLSRVHHYNRKNPMKNPP